MRRGPEEGDRPSGWNVGGVARPQLTPGQDRDDGTVMQGGKGHRRETTEAYSREQLGVTSSWGGRHFGWLLCCISGIQVNTLFLSAPEGPLYAVCGRGSRGELPAHEWGAVQRRVGDNPSRRDGTRDEFRAGRPRTLDRRRVGMEVCMRHVTCSGCLVSGAWWCLRVLLRLQRSTATCGKWNACLLVGVVVVNRRFRGLAIGGRRGNGRGSGAVEGCRRRKTRSGKHKAVNVKFAVSRIDVS